MNKVVIIIICLAVLAVGVAYRFVQIIPRNMGTGESKPSPNNEFIATAFDWSSESFFGKTRFWYEFKIENKNSHELIQQIETTPIPGPYFGSRSSHSVINWNENSSEVVFTFPTLELKMKTERPSIP
jgi:hypothetical protein